MCIIAGKDRYWKEKDGRFYARIAVPKRLQPYLARQRSELIEPLGGDRREARKKLHQAVARLKQELSAAERRAGSVKPATDIAQLPATPITLGDFGRAVWQRYNDHLENDEAARRRFPTQAEIDLAREKLFAKVQNGEVPADPLGALDAVIDMLLVQEARNLDSQTRKVRLDALRRELVIGATHQVEHEIDACLEENRLSAPEGSSDRRVLAEQMMRAEIEALRRTLERDQGDYTGQPSDPIVKPPAKQAPAPVNLSQLWEDYRGSRVRAGFLKDGDKRQEPVIRNLRSFLGHNC